MSNAIFVCDLNTEFFKTWYEKKDTFDKELDQERDFLKKRAEALQKRREDFWKEIWDLAQASGKIPKNYKWDDYGMSVNDDSGQLFIEKQETDHPLHKLMEFLNR